MNKTLRVVVLVAMATAAVVFNQCQSAGAG